MKNLFIVLKIIENLLEIIIIYLTDSHINLLNEKLEKIDIEKIIKYDPELM
jgi:hypothetical protein